MATRGAIARINQDGKSFLGVRHQKYSMPEALGKTLWNLYHNHFKGDLEAMLKYLIDDHSAGWSNIVNANFELPPNYQTDPKNVGPQCYCHGRLSASAYPVTAKTVFEQAISWVYLFDVEAKTMFVVYYDLKSKLVNNSYTVALDGDEPNWVAIRCGEKYERCEHLASEHFPALVNTPSGRLRTPVYMNQEPLTVVDVCAIYVDGVRYEMTGRTKQGNGVIHAFVVQKGGKAESDFTIAQVDATMPGGYRPSERITWVFPATKKDAGEETLATYAQFVTLHRDGKKKKLLGKLDLEKLLIQVGDRQFVAE